MGNKRHWILLSIAVLLVLGGGLLAGWINTGAGKATVSEVTIKDPPGYAISALLYVPKGASAKSPAPAVLMIHGLNNEKKFMSNTALEFARRGYVVLSMDQPGHGRSTGANGDNAGGAVGPLKYLAGLPMVDKANIGLLGMSQGGFLSATNAAFLVPDGYKAIFYMDSEVNSPGSPDLSKAVGLKNAAFSIGSMTEMGVMIFVARGRDARVSPVLMPVFGTKEPIEIGKVYGSIADGTARILYQPWGTHPGSTDSRASIGNALDWMGRTLSGGAAISASDQIWPWKSAGSILALFGVFLFLFPMGSLLLKTPFFKSLVEPVPEFHGLRGGMWWLAALLTTGVGPLLYLGVWKKMFFSPILAPNRIWPENFTNVIMVWSLLTAAIGILLTIVTHLTATRRQGASAESYGLWGPGEGFPMGKVLKSLLWAAVTLLPMYLCLLFVEAVWKVDSRLWIIALLPMTGPRFSAFLGYLLPFAVICAYQAVLLMGLLRPREGKVSLGREMVTNSVILTLGALVWLAILYVPLAAGSPIVFASDPIGATAAGMGGIYYIPMLVFYPLSACVYTYFFRKTGRVYTGVFLVTLLQVWQLAALGVMAFALN